VHIAALAPESRAAIESVQRQIFEHCDEIIEYLRKNIELFKTDDDANELDAYLRDWSIVLGVLAADTFEDVIALLRQRKVRGPNMLSRALVDYDIRLRYYEVQSVKARRAYRKNPALPLDHLKSEMEAAADWENAGFKLAKVVGLYDPSVWPDEAKGRLEEILRLDGTARQTDFTRMVSFLKANEVDIRGVIPTFAEPLRFRYANIPPAWKMQSCFLHGDHSIISDVIEFRRDGAKTGRYFQYGSAPINTILFTATDHVEGIIRTMGMIRGFVYGEVSLSERTGQLWRKYQESVRLHGGDEFAGLVPH
jgi:hypothetical protein